MVQLETVERLAHSWYESDATNATQKTGLKIVYGWSWIDSSNSTSLLAKQVAFGISFSSAPIVLISDLGRSDSGTPSSPGSFQTDSIKAWATSDITSTQFKALVTDSTGSSNYNWGFAWVAIGV